MFQTINFDRSNPQNICGFFWRFLIFPRMSICAQVLGSRVNRGAGYGLDVPVHVTFQCHTKCVSQVKKKINDTDQAAEARFKRCMKNAIYNYFEGLL